MFARCKISICCLLAFCGVLRAAEGDGSPDDVSHERVCRLETLLKAGRFQEFAEAAIPPATSDPQPAGLPRLQAEALLAMGRNREAETVALRQLLVAARSSAAPLDPGLLKLWLTARWRQARGPDEPALDPWLKEQVAAGAPAVAALRFWREALAGAAPYRLPGESRRSVLSMTAAKGSEAQTAVRRDPESLGLETITLDINGMRLPQVFVDTGAQHTLLTPAAAAAAGVEVGPDCVAMVGFSNFRARPAIVRQLRLGELVLDDVPVYVGESPALAQVAGQASLGIDLMYHVRFVMDYPRRQVIVEPAATASGSREPVAEPSPADWEIPLWTFSQTCLAQGRMPDGEFARTLIDTGNRQGTYLSSRWANRRLPDFQPLKTWFVQRYHLGKYSVGRWELGNLQLQNWPVRGILPAGLERLDVVDLLVGHDLLSHYRVEIDLPARRLILSEPALGF
jgi:hypothetical protein